jgi:hypothetical protein
MNDKDALIELKKKIIKYIKHIIKTSSIITDDDIKKYFIFWLYLTSLTDKRITIDDEALNNDEKKLVNKLVLRVIDYQKRKQSIKNLNTNIENKLIYFSTKFYLDCGLYNIEGLLISDYLQKSEEWYNAFVRNTEDYKNCMKINIVQPPANTPMSSVNMESW